MPRKPIWCYRCGKPLSFRNIDGIVRPFHPENNTACRPAATHLQFLLPLFTQLFVPAFEEPVTKGHCRCQLKPVILTVRHKDGIVRFEQLDESWKRHECDHTVNPDLGLDHLSRQLAGNGNEVAKLALVAAVRQMWGGRPSVFVAALECGNPKRRHCMEVRYDESTPPKLTERARVHPGSLVALCGTGAVRRVVNLSDFSFECVDPHCAPGNLDIPAEWFRA
jgi:hypothetical protein